MAGETASQAFLDYAGVQLLVFNIKQEIQAAVNGLEALPVGSIVMWSGTSVPSGWAICDGQNGTPDLRGRFVMGSSADHSIGESGGSDTHTLTVEELPAHKHTVSGVNVTTDGNGGSLFAGGEDSMIPSDQTDTSETGGGVAMNILPPYYVLAYIMKLAPV